MGLAEDREVSERGNGLNYRFLSVKAEEEAMIRALFEDRPETVVFSEEETANADGPFVTVTLSGLTNTEAGHSLHLSGGPERYTLEYSSRTALCRGIGRLLQAVSRGGETEEKETLSFERILPMIDCSRNAVPKTETLKRFVRTTALLGFNALMLYTEDTYEVADEPYFGRLRGRYTEEELKELDCFAALFGVELIPCIQTLAHLDAIFKWQEYAARKDWDNILNLAEEKNYELIERCIASCRRSFTSRRIHIGMDEAYLLGRGHYLETMGYRPSSEIMKEHLGKVLELCRKYGFQAELWSDMFFRMSTKSHTYYDPDIQITEAVKAAVPEDAALVYWDYYSVDAERYERMFRNHEELTDRISFAGGTSSWYGLVPMTRFSLNAAKTALESALRHRVREIIVTMWGDDGAACPLFSVLPTLVLYAEGAWGQGTDDETAAEVMKSLFGLDLNAYLELEALQCLPGRKNFGKKPMNPTKYLFYQDPLQGKYEAHVPEGAEAHFRAESGKLRAFTENGAFGEFRYVGETMTVFAEALSLKAEFGRSIRQCYARPKEEAKPLLLALLRDRIPHLKSALSRFHEAFRTEWMTEHKPFGYEVMDVRLAGVEARVRYAEQVLSDYLEGKTDRIPELEEEILPVKPAEDGVLISENVWSRIISASIIR